MAASDSCDAEVNVQSGRVLSDGPAKKSCQEYMLLLVASGKHAPPPRGFPLDQDTRSTKTSSTRPYHKYPDKHTVERVLATKAFGGVFDRIWFSPNRQGKQARTYVQGSFLERRNSVLLMPSCVLKHLVVQVLLGNVVKSRKLPFPRRG